MTTVEKIIRDLSLLEPTAKLEVFLFGFDYCTIVIRWPDRNLPYAVQLRHVNNIAVSADKDTPYEARSEAIEHATRYHLQQFNDD